MASPTCLVKDGSGSYGATTNGVNVTAANTISIKLESAAGVDSWSITCIGTDENLVPATITAGLSINSSTKVATFTAPAAGSCMIFKSVINGGVESPSGVTRSDYTTTFSIHVLTGSLRVAAANETTESSATYGWVGKINAAIRASASVPTFTGTGFAHVTSGVLDAAAKKVALNDTADVTGTLAGGNGGTGIAISGAIGDASKIPIVNGSGTAYALGLIANANVDSAAAIAVSKLATSTAYYTLSINSGGTTPTYGLLTNNHIDSAAAIAVSKLATSTAYYTLSINSAGTTPTYGLLTNNHIDSAAAIAYSKLATTTANYALVMNGAGTAVTGALIVNANVDAAAAIACTKTDGAFVGTNVTFTTGYIGAVATRAATGFIRLGTSSTGIVALDSGGTLDKVYMAHASDQLYIGCSSSFTNQHATIRAYAGTTFYIGIGSTNYATFASSQITFGKGTVPSTVTKTADYTVTSSEDVILVGTLSAGITLTLPASPVTGQRHKINAGPSALTYNVTIGRNSKTINGASANDVLVSAYENAEYTYDGSGWIRTL